MPRIRSERKPRRRRRRRYQPWLNPALAGAYIEQLAMGWDFFNSAWGRDISPISDPPADVREDMAECWSIFRSEVEDVFNQFHGAHAKYVRPWAWWLFETDAPYDFRTPQPIRLWRLGELTAEECNTAINTLHPPGDRREFNLRIARKYTTPAEQLLLGIHPEGRQDNV